MKNYIKEEKNGRGDISVVRHFYFKVNESKIKDQSVFEGQVKKVIERIRSNYNLINKDVKMDMGYTEDDFICNVFRLRISFYCA